MNNKGSIVDSGVAVMIFTVMFYITLIFFNAINSPALLMGQLSNTTLNPNGAATQTILNLFMLVLVAVGLISIIRTMNQPSQPSF
jgi:hypothetical protein